MEFVCGCGACMAESGSIRRRLVFYVSGFDPRGPRFYHQLYKTEAARQQAVSGYVYQVSARQADGDLASYWTIQAHSERHGDTETRYTFLRWDDIVREHWPHSRWAVIRAMGGFYRTYATYGAFAATRKAVPRTFWTMMSPAIYGFLVLVLAAGAGTLLHWLLGSFGVPRVITAAAAVAVAAVAVKAGVTVADNMRFFWLMRILLFMRQWASAEQDPFSARWSAFAARIAADIERYPADEVVVVGHSVGVPAAIAVVDMLVAMRVHSGKGPLPALKLLTLGQVAPLLGLIPQAGWFRAHMLRVGASDVPWLDYTAPGDPLSFVLADPFKLCGLATPTRAGYRMKSSRFDKMFAPAAFAPIRKDAFRIHFQYLMATDLPVDNDYFSLTAGARPMAV
jgi:hypothetical protein